MDINRFYSNNLNDRMKIVNHSGEFIWRIKYYGFYINLYVVESEFVEVYYNSHTNAIEDVEIIDCKEPRLAIYAGYVNISDVFNKTEL